MRLLLVRVLLQLAWSVGGHRDEVDGLPRLVGADLGDLIGLLRPGDVVLLGNNGLLSHVAVYVGDGEIVHALATERTMRGRWGALADALRRAFGAPEPNVGVVREALAGFVDRFERDTWLVLRWPDLTADELGRGLRRVLELVGRPYDYGFRDQNEAWYCTEVVDAFLRAAVGDRTPAWSRRRVRVPLLLDTEVVEPVALLESGAFAVVGANAAASVNYGRHLPTAGDQPARA